MIRQKANVKWPKRNGYYYFNKNGGEVKYPSVTSILDIMDKGGLMFWAVQQASRIALDDPTLSEKEVSAKFSSISRDAATRGKGVHNTFQRILEGNFQYENAIEKYKPYIDGIIAFQKEYKVTPIANEKIIKSDKYQFAGTADQLVSTRNEVWLLDLKTSKAVYESHKLQLAAYKQALQEEGVNVSKTAVLLVPGDGTFALVETNAPLEVFLCAKKIWEWKKGVN